MIFTPSIINRDYKKNEAFPPAVLINFAELPQLPIVNGPTWLTFYDITLTTLKVKLNAEVNNIAPGQYSEVCNVVIHLDEVNKNINLGSFTFELNLEDTIILNVSPSSAPFEYTLGGAAPVNKSYIVTSENNWIVTKTVAWVLLPTISGSNSGSFQIGVDTTGLVAGIYNDIVTVDDGVNTINIAVSLTVSDPNTGTDYLYITPTKLNFGYSSGGSTPPQKSVELNASANWTAAANQSWVNLTTAAGSAGVAVVPIALQNISGLTIGEHFATVTFTVGTILKTVNIQLSVYQFVTDILTPGILHFCDDDNVIKVSSSRLDTFMQLEITTLYKSKSYSIPFSIPYFLGTTQKRIGSAPKKIIGDQTFVEIAEASLFAPYPTISLDIVISELEMFTKNLVQAQSINNVKFVKGTKPFGNLISDAPSKRYLTKNEVLYFSILTNGIAASAINVTGAFTKTFNFPPITNDILTVVVPLSEVGALVVGDKITVEVLDNAIEVEIKDEGKDNSIIYWCNKWGVWDTVGLTGRVVINNSYNRKFSTLRKTELTTQTKLIDVTKPIDYKINTGWIHTTDEVEMISKMLGAANMYLFTKNQLVKVNPLTKKLTFIDTDRELRSFELTFKNVIE